MSAAFILAFSCVSFAGSAACLVGTLYYGRRGMKAAERRAEIQRAVDSPAFAREITATFDPATEDRIRASARSLRWAR